ncbi:SpoIIE family protein phosphatase [Bordetella genomosp. 1]|nr:SpoIIE family protein phosphatase [Bordetella genomosp. 1]
MLRSLRSKIFILILAILFVVATIVMLVSQRDVTRTVRAGELHAVSNVMDLLMRDTSARWSALLDDKFAAARGGRHQLVEVASTTLTMLNMFADLAERGVVTPGAAKGMARNWINQLKLSGRRYAFVYDATHSVLASGNRNMIDLDISSIEDIKNRRLAQAMYDESRQSGHGFAFYRWKVPGSAGEPEARYGYFGYFRPWDWVFVISFDAQDMIDEVQARRRKAEEAVRATLSRLTLARTGFVFVVADDGSLVVAPPAEQANLLDIEDRDTHHTLRGLLRAAGTEQPISFAFDGGAAGRYEMQAQRHKPLGWTIVAAVPESDLTAPATQLINRQAIIFGLALLGALLFAWVVASRIVRPLGILTRYARELPLQDLTAPRAVPEAVSSLPARLHDEVGRLAESFLFMDRKLRENITRLMQETTARERFESELNIARDIQLGLLPVPLESHTRSLVDLNAVMQPAKEVGGDLYDYFMLPDGRLCLAIGDVSDKGVPAALFMAVTRTLIRATAEDETDPALILQKINNRLSENNPNMMFVTLLLGVLDLQTGELTWANAGHLPPAVLGLDGTVRLLEGRSGPACGVQEGLVYRSLNARIGPGEALVGFTDGVTEAESKEGKQYGDARMRYVLSYPPLSASDISRRLLDDVHAFADGAEQSDDITLIVIRRS